MQGSRLLSRRRQRLAGLALGASPAGEDRVEARVVKEQASEQMRLR